ncbi:MAG: hypothetical protein WBL63_18740 [Candidatus Acidiferrum sp.]
MQRYAAALVCVISVFASQVHAQKIGIEPIHVAAGAVLTFHLQTRLNPGSLNETDVLPRGTVIRVRMLDPIDSNVDRDGSKFRGEVVSSIATGNEIVVHSESEVRGLLALLRSRSHPEGFRYELLVTRVNDHGKSYDLTASLNPSFFDAGAQRESVVKSGTSKNPEGRAGATEKSPGPTPN